MNYILDGRYMTSKEEAHRYLAEALGLPAYYGKNLDALSDCLGEMKVGTEIQLHYAEEMQAALGTYGERLVRVFQEAKNLNFMKK